MAMAVGRSGATVSDINVTPMVDIMLVLLIIFMVVTPMLQKTMSVDMVKAQYPRDMADADKEDAVVIAITRDGKMFIGNTPTTPEEMTTKVKDMLADKVDRTVYIKSDARAKYGDVVKAVDNVRAAGVESLGLLTQRLKPSEVPPAAMP
ncbi:MAG: biopolymer transporter ExbD [Terriglobia bacterium]